MAQLTHADFARHVLTAAMPPDRVASVIAHILGDRIEIGPIRVGPAGVAYATVHGVPGVVDAAYCDDPDWTIAVSVPVSLNVRVHLAGRPARYRIDLNVRTRIRQVLEEPCTVIIEMDDVRRGDVDASVNPHGMPSRVLGWIGNINSQVGDQVVSYFNDLVSSPAVVEVRRINVADLIGRAWDAGLVVDIPRNPQGLPPLEIAHRAG